MKNLLKNKDEIFACKVDTGLYEGEIHHNQEKRKNTLFALLTAIAVIIYKFIMDESDFVFPIIAIFFSFKFISIHNHIKLLIIIQKLNKDNIEKA